MFQGIETNSCRICAESKMINITLDDNTDGASLVAMLRYCSNLEIHKDDGLPYQCCIGCRSDLIVAYRLVIRCHHANIKFRQHLQESKSYARTISDEDPGFTLVETNNKTETAADREYIDANAETENKLEIDEKLEDEPPPKIPQHCCKCKLQLSTMEQVREHSRTVHLPERCKDLAIIKSRPYECAVCYNRYVCKQGLLLHERLLYNECPYQCDQCGVNFKRSSLLKQHKATHDDMIAIQLKLEPDELVEANETEIAAEDENVSSEECVPTAPLIVSEQSLSIHNKVVEKELQYMDDAADDDYEDDAEDKLEIDFKLDDVDQDSSEEEPPPNKKVLKTPQRCCRCKLQLSTMEEVLEHSRTVHLPERCKDSAKIKARPFECSVCYKRYASKQSLQLHETLLYVKNAYQCDQCGMNFRKNSLLEQHKGTHDDMIIVQPKPKPDGQLPRCCACYEQFYTDELLMKHCQTVHEPESESTDFQNKFQCGLCYRRYKNIKTLKEHQVKPYREFQFQCATCGLTYRDKNALSDHERSHKDGKAYQCPICSKSFVVKTYYKRHIKLHTTAEDRYKCEICGKGFKAKYGLKSHLITHNADHRPLQCDFCPATFARKMCLQQHVKLHTGVKPYKCNQCSAAYTFPTDLKRHIMAHDGIKPYKCTVCDRGYPRKDYLKRHMELHRLAKEKVTRSKRNNKS